MSNLQEQDLSTRTWVESCTVPCSMPRTGSSVSIDLWSSGKAGLTCSAAEPNRCYSLGCAATASYNVASDNLGSMLLNRDKHIDPVIGRSILHNAAYQRHCQANLTVWHVTLAHMPKELYLATQPTRQAPALILVSSNK